MNTIKLTKDLPNEDGYYWWLNKYKGQETVRKIVCVSKYKRLFHASDGEYQFTVRKSKSKKDENFWGKIPELELP